jgi:K+-transporting ATPase A subunit
MKNGKFHARAFTIRDGSANLGNFYRDFIRFTTRVLLPVSFVLALVMIQQATTKPVVAEVNIGKVIAVIWLKFESVVSPP